MKTTERASRKSSYSVKLMSLLYSTFAPLPLSDWNLTQCLELLQLFHSREKSKSEDRSASSKDDRAEKWNNPLSFGIAQLPRQPGRPTSRLAIQLGRIVSCAINSLSVGFLLTALSRETLTHVHKMTYTEVCHVKNYKAQCPSKGKCINNL